MCSGRCEVPADGGKPKRKSARTAAGRKSALLAALKHARAALDDLIRVLGE
jgi:hypothetical protein